MSEPGEVSLEAGHIYAPDVYLKPPVISFEDNFSGAGEIVSTPVHIGLLIARQLRKKLFEEGLSVRQILLVDDVDPRIKQQESSDSSRWELFIQRPIQQIINSERGSHISVYSEFDFTAEAELLVETLRQLSEKSNECRLSQDRNSIIFGSGKKRKRVRLVGYNEEYPTLPSCEVLDVCAYRKRLKENPETITVLPVGYKSQQDRVRSLLHLLKESSNVSVIYYDSEGSVVAIDQWHNQPTQVAGVIKEAVGLHAVP